MALSSSFSRTLYFQRLQLALCYLLGPDHDGSHFKNFIQVAAVSNHLHPPFGNEVGKDIVSYCDFDFWRECLSEIREPRGRAEILEGAKRTFE